ncbi:hypothetical protein R3P38DRAFT_3278903 [Favolaschia claudopus]|uniref:Uncharacterized protein n=1 Tax=Favolaschia claudopus TaxID=2862362 RepID=A0AAW0AIN9_9AGAR
MSFRAYVHEEIFKLTQLVSSLPFTHTRPTQAGLPAAPSPHHTDFPPHPRFSAFSRSRCIGSVLLFQLNPQCCHRPPRYPKTSNTDVLISETPTRTVPSLPR